MKNNTPPTLLPPVLATIFWTFAALALSGCADVAPWERGNLAKAHMALDPYPTQTTWREHVYGSREAATGSASATGGGCGCY